MIGAAAQSAPAEWSEPPHLAGLRSADDAELAECFQRLRHELKVDDPRLERLIGAEPPFGHRLAVALELASPRPYLPLPALAAGAADDSAEVRRCAVLALSGRSEAAAEALLLRAMDDVSPTVVHAAAGVLADRLATAADGDAVRAALISVLTADLPQQWNRELWDELEMRRGVLRRCPRAGAVAVPVLSAALEFTAPANPHWAFEADTLRVAALGGLAEVGAAAVPVRERIVALLQARADRFDLQTAALRALAAMPADQNAAVAEVLAVSAAVYRRTRVADHEPGAPAGWARVFASRRAELMAAALDVIGALGARAAAAAPLLADAVRADVAQGAAAGALLRVAGPEAAADAVASRLATLAADALSHDGALVRALPLSGELCWTARARLLELAGDRAQPQGAAALQALSLAAGRWSAEQRGTVAGALLERAAASVDPVHQGSLLRVAIALDGDAAAAWLRQHPDMTQLLIELAREAPWHLVPRLDDGEPAVRQRTAEIMQGYARSSALLMQAFAELLANERLHDAGLVLQALAHAGPTPAVTALVAAWLDRPRPRTREQLPAWSSQRTYAVWCLARIGPEAWPHMQRVLHGDLAVKLLEQLRLLGPAGAPLVPQLVEFAAAEPDYGYYVRRTLAHFGREGLRALEAMAVSEEELLDCVGAVFRLSRDVEVLRPAASLLLSRRLALPETIDLPWVERLDPELGLLLQLVAINAGDGAGSEVPRGLLRALVATDPTVRRRAIEALARQPWREQVLPWLRWMERDADQGVREAAVRAVQQLHAGR